MHHVRPAAVAGSFYPSQRRALSEQLHTLLAEAGRAAADPTARLKALIVPHAGYVYSGRTAAAAYALLAPLKEQVRRVVLLGPVHRVPVRGLALPQAEALATPLGEVRVDAEAVATVRALPQVVTSAAAHAREHSLEVQLPFLQAMLGDFEVLPLAVGDASAQQVAEVLEAVWGGPETLIVISSDLSHYLPYDTAQVVDHDTVARILALTGPLTHEQACGGTPINGLLLKARRHGLQPRLLQQCNSGDSCGDHERVVGYASIAFCEPAREEASHAAH